MPSPPPISARGLSREARQFLRDEGWTPFQTPDGERFYRPPHERERAIRSSWTVLRLSDNRKVSKANVIILPLRYTPIDIDIDQLPSRFPRNTSAVIRTDGGWNVVLDGDAPPRFQNLQDPEYERWSKARGGYRIFTHSKESRLPDGSPEPRVMYVLKIGKIAQEWSRSGGEVVVVNRFSDIGKR